MQLSIQSAFVVLICAWFEASSSWAEPRFTANKQGLCAQCLASEWPIEKPLHGLVVVSGSILSPEVEWMFLNIDSRQLSKVIAIRGSGTPAWIIRQRENREIESGDLGPLIAIANNIWSSGVLRPQRHSPTDGWQEIYLLDEENIRRERYANLTELAEQVRPALIRAWNKHQ